MKNKFIVVYAWDYETTIHHFDTLEEAIEDRNNYSNPSTHRIYQLVEEETKTTLTLPDGTVVEL